VLTDESRLRSTLSHEMCHVAAWVISRDYKAHHGETFFAWARWDAAASLHGGGSLRAW
jgi:predicted SprT family Zn-dependent metalloprotease